MEKDILMIDSFRGEYAFLSNFYECDIVYNGLHYNSVEAAFQAQKTLNPKEREEFTNLSPSAAKRKGRKVKLREDWEQQKVNLMTEIVFIKFISNTDLAIKLLQTKKAELVEGNNWNDRFWGICKGVGHNTLGYILMMVRSYIHDAVAKEIMEHSPDTSFYNIVDSALKHIIYANMYRSTLPF